MQINFRDDAIFICTDIENYALANDVGVAINFVRSGEIADRKHRLRKENDTLANRLANLQRLKSEDVCRRWIVECGGAKNNRATEAELRRKYQWLKAEVIRVQQNRVAKRIMRRTNEYRTIKSGSGTSHRISAIFDGRCGLSDLTELIKRVLTEDLWGRQVMPGTNETIVFSRFEAFLRGHHQEVGERITRRCTGCARTILKRWIYSSRPNN